MTPRTGCAMAALVPLLAAASPAPPRISATASCEQRPSKGRVLCEVELETEGARIAWADVVVVAAPLFAPPLRSRIGVADARVRTERRIRLPVAFVATATGKGTVAFRARLVACQPGERGDVCRTSTKDVETELSVGVEAER